MRHSRIIISLFAAAITSIHADTIVLKSGKKLEGRVISQDANSYLFEIKVTSTIKDERRIPADQVQEIIKETEDSKEFKKIQAAAATPDLLTAAGYENRIAKVKNFLSSFPKSPHHKAANTALKSLEKEYAVISAGGIKQDGQLISRSDMEANAYEIHARMLLSDIQKLTSAGQYRESLRKWNKLKADYSNSTSFTRGIPLARRSLLVYKSQLKQLADTLTARMEKRESALKSMNDNDRLRTQAALADKQKRHDALVEKEKEELKLKWLSVDTFDKSSIDQSLRLAESELSAISNIDPSKIKPAGSSYRDAWTALAEGNLEEASAHISNLKSLRIPERYTKQLADQLTDKKEVREAAKQKALREAAAEKRRQDQLAKEAAEKAAAEKAKKPRGKKSRKRKPAPAKD
ncbi:MAG: PTPDL family protein [Akkermansiaceae bacterium]